MSNGGFAHPAALVESDELGEGTRVWAFAHVLRGARVGSNCNIGDHAFVEGRAVIGNNVTVKNNVCIWDGITLEDDVFVGPNVAFTNDRHARSPRMEIVRERYEELERWMEPTTVRRGATLGANSTIMPGLVLGEFCFVAAGAVVTKDVAPYVLVAGNPAKPIGYVCRCGKRVAENRPESNCKDCESLENNTKQSGTEASVRSSHPVS